MSFPLQAWAGHRPAGYLDCPLLLLQVCVRETFRNFALGSNNCSFEHPILLNFIFCHHAKFSFRPKVNPKLPQPHLMSKSNLPPTAYYIQPFSLVFHRWFAHLCFGLGRGQIIPPSPALFRTDRKDLNSNKTKLNHSILT